MVHDSWLFVAWTPVQIKGFGVGELSKYFTAEEQGRELFFAQIRYFRFEGCEW